VHFNTIDHNYNKLNHLGQTQSERERETETVTATETEKEREKHIKARVQPALFINMKNRM